MTKSKLRLPVLIGIAIAFSALWLIFTLILNYWSTKERHQNLENLVEQVDDQLYQVGENTRYRMLTTATLLAKREDMINGIKTENNAALKTMLSNFYQSYSNQTLLEQLQVFSNTGELIASYGSSNSYFNQPDSHETLYKKKDSATGVSLTPNGSLYFYAVNAVIDNGVILGYVQASKSFLDALQNVSSLNKTNLHLLIDKSHVDKEAVTKQYQQLGLIEQWNIFQHLIIASPIYSNINLTKLAKTLDPIVVSDLDKKIFLFDEVEIGASFYHLALFPIHNTQGDYLGRILLLKDISLTSKTYQYSFALTSVSFGIIMTLMFATFWFFLGRIERNILNAESSMIKAKNDAETLRDKAKKAEQDAINANQIKSEFLAKMSHELRTPLNAIIGISEMMFEDAKQFSDTTYIEPLERVLHSGHHLLNLINDILDLSKIEAGKMELHPEVFELISFIGDIKRTCEPLALKNNNTLLVEVEPNIGDLYADVTKLRQILLNLISNACKFTHDGQITLVFSKTTINNLDHIHFSIIDTGIGMDNQQLSKLFSDFQQIDSSATRKYEGTGLGLSISQKLAKLMGGHITVESQINQGSEFTLIIPAIMPIIHIQPQIQVHQPIKVISPSPNKTKILLVDDDEDMVALHKHHLINSTTLVTNIADYANAMQVIKDSRPDIIIINTLSKTQNGKDILDDVVNTESVSLIPVVVICNEDKQRDYLELGAKYCLFRPFNKNKLSQIFSQIKPDNEQNFK